MNKILDILKFIIIGIIQGLTEILPISSSGHLALAYNILRIDTSIQLDLTIFLHLSSTLALCIYFKDIIFKIVKGFIGFIFSKNAKYKDDFLLGIYILISSIPICIVGLFIKPIVESSFENLLTIGIGFLITAISLFVCNKIHFKNTMNKYNFKNTLITGIFQCLSVFPGISRSGMTILGAKVAKLDDKTGKLYAFLLLIPISIGSSFLSILDMFNSDIISNNIILYIISMIMAFIFTMLTLKLFFRKNTNKQYYYFSIYLIILGILTIFIGCYFNISIYEIFLKKAML